MMRRVLLNPNTNTLFKVSTKSKYILFPPCQERAWISTESTGSNPNPRISSKLSISTKCKSSQMSDEQYKEIMQVLHDQKRLIDQLDNRLLSMQSVGIISLGVATCNWLIGILMFSMDIHIVT